MFDRRRATPVMTPVILLTGCHETQFNVKALNRMDPWTVSITSVIKNNIRRKRGVPTYSVLYNEAKKIRTGPTHRGSAQ